MTLTLYYSPGACSLAAHIALEEAGETFEPRRVNLPEGEQRSPEYLALNPKGRVPVLVDGDFVLTEVPAILRYVARRNPAAGLWPDDPRNEARCAEWLAWCSSGIHVTYAHVRRPERYATAERAREDVAETGREATRKLWSEVDRKIGALPGPFLLGPTFSVADGYLLVFWTWARTPALGLDPARDLPDWTAHARRVAERPAVRRVLEREGIAPP